MSALLCDIRPGDEVIMPTYTFVSTANAFALRGAVIRFADSERETPSISADEIEALITPKTKAVVVVHYGGVACDLDRICDIVRQHKLFLIEDAAHAIDSYWNGKPLGSFGDLATFSFHETKNIGCGEGGMLVINNAKMHETAEIVWEKGTNRSQFYRGQVNKYNWQTLGSSFLPSDLTAACLYAQLQELDSIQTQRKEIWHRYQNALASFPVRYGASANGHLYYIESSRENVLEDFAAAGIQALSHYITLHDSPFYADKHDGRELPNATRYQKTLIRLPIYVGLTTAEQNEITEHVFLLQKNPST